MKSVVKNALERVTLSFGIKLLLLIFLPILLGFLIGLEVGDLKAQVYLATDGKPYWLWD